VSLRSLALVLVGCVSVFGREAVQEFRLPNGLRVLLAENHERPLVRLEFRTAWQPSREPEGLGEFLGELLKTSGAGPLSRDAFQGFLEVRALRLSFAVLPRSFAWSILSDSQSQDGAFEALALAATRPDLDGAAMEARRQSLIQAFREQSPRIRVEDRFLRRIGDPSRSLIPEEGSLNRVEYQALLQLARRILRPENAVLVIQGDMNLSQARQLSMLHLGAWARGSQVPAAARPLAQTPPTRTWLIREAGTAIQVKLGSPGTAEPPLSASILELCAWLAQREVASSLPTPLKQGAFRSLAGGGWKLEVAGGTSMPEVMDAVQALLRHLRGLKLGSEDMAAARRAWMAGKQSRVLHPQQEAASLAERALLSDRVEEDTEQLTAEGVQAALQQLFAANSISYFISGGVPQDTAWLVKAGLGPVETVN